MTSIMKLATKTHLRVDGKRKKAMEANVCVVPYYFNKFFVQILKLTIVSFVFSHPKNLIWKHWVTTSPDNG